MKSRNNPLVSVPESRAPRGVADVLKFRYKLDLQDPEMAEAPGLRPPEASVGDPDVCDQSVQTRPGRLTSPFIARAKDPSLFPKNITPFAGRPVPLRPHLRTEVAA